MVVVVHRFFFNDTATTEIYTLSLHDALPIYIHNITKKGENFLDINVFSIKFAPLNETTSNTCRYFWHGFWQRVLALGAGNCRCFASHTYMAGIRRHTNK